MIKNGLVGDWWLSDSEFTASFHLPHARDRVEALKTAHPFPSDEQILFDEEYHTYRVHGVVVSIDMFLKLLGICDWDPIGEKVL